MSTWTTPKSFHAATLCAAGFEGGRGQASAWRDSDSLREQGRLESGIVMTLATPTMHKA